MITNGRPPETSASDFRGAKFGAFTEFEIPKKVTGYDHISESVFSIDLVVCQPAQGHL